MYPQSLEFAGLQTSGWEPLYKISIIESVLCMNH